MIDPATERTISVMEHRTRTADDIRTHTERINGAKGGRFGDAEETGEPQIDYSLPRPALSHDGMDRHR